MFSHYTNKLKWATCYLVADVVMVYGFGLLYEEIASNFSLTPEEASAFIQQMKMLYISAGTGAVAALIGWKSEDKSQRERPILDEQLASGLLASQISVGNPHEVKQVRPKGNIQESEPSLADVLETKQNRVAKSHNKLRAETGDEYNTLPGQKTPPVTKGLLSCCCLFKGKPKNQSPQESVSEMEVLSSTREGVYYDDLPSREKAAFLPYSEVV